MKKQKDKWWTTYFKHQDCTHNKKYKSESYVIHHKVDCIHKQHLVNQGITMCEYGDPSKCDECPHRTPEEYDSIVSYASTGLSYASTE